MNKPRHPRDYGGSFKLHNPDDGTPIREMFALGERLLIITDKCTYGMQVADQVDPGRTNPTLPHNFQQKLFDHGVEFELLCRSFLHAKVLFRKEFQQIDVEHAMQLAFEAFGELALMQEETQAFKAAEATAIERLQTPKHRDGSLALPAVGNARSRCKTFAQKADHAAAALLSIVRLFYVEMKGKKWSDFLELIKGRYGDEDNFHKVLALTVPFLQMVRNARDCLEHHNVAGAITRDFTQEADGRIAVPSIAIDFRGTVVERCSISEFMGQTTMALLDSFEMITLNLCGKNVQPFAGMPMTVALLDDSYQKAWHVRFGYGCYYADGRFVPCG